MTCEAKLKGIGGGREKIELGSKMKRNRRSWTIKLSWAVNGQDSEELGSKFELGNQMKRTRRSWGVNFSWGVKVEGIRGDGK